MSENDKKDSSAKSSGKNKKKSGGRIRNFFRGVKAEWKKIIWPDRITLAKQLAAVLCVTVITALIIVVVDFGAQNLIDLITTL